MTHTVTHHRTRDHSPPTPQTQIWCSVCKRVAEFIWGRMDLTGCNVLYEEIINMPIKGKQVKVVPMYPETQQLAMTA